MTFAFKMIACDDGAGNIGVDGCRVVDTNGTQIAHNISYKTG